MDFNDLIEVGPAPQKRVSKVADSLEHKMHEGAVIVAYAMHPLRTTTATHIWIHPDGEPGKRFGFVGSFASRGFEKFTSVGDTSYGGEDRNENGWQITINPSSEKGYVVT
ncbi:hypothetical protein LWC05_14045 [Acetobacter sicerae]|uniref:Uncharacterized protein n=1 Tax=Acetobacter sicerae TaxID=85325 RepID=A0ABS8VYZ4_9PROT|nr:hypothetical protein [Acetobacter sicerae]MCE0744999.1 hypothetical protein [Acetobacter sicerae]